MRSEDERSLGRSKGLDLSRKGRDPIRIEDDRKVQRLDQLEDEGLCLLEGPDSGSDYDGLLVFAEAEDRIEGPEAEVCLGVSGSGSVMTSVNFTSMTALRLLGMPRVTKPAPIRRAASHAMAAAPVFPTDPARTRRWP